MAEFIKTFNHGTSKIVLNHSPSLPATPIELHYKEDGTVDDKSSLAMVMALPGFLSSAVTGSVVGEFSLQTLTDCLNELGYDIIKL